MMNKSLSKNYLLNMLYQLIIIIIPIIIIPFLAERLKPEGVGLYSYSLSIVTYFTFIALLGVQMYGTKTISLNSKDENQLRKVFWELFILKLMTSTLAIVLFFGFAIYINSPVFYIQGIILFANLLDITWFFTGTERFKPIVFRNLV